jgi:hypothetical protein
MKTVRYYVHAIIDKPLLAITGLLFLISPSLLADQGLIEYFEGEVSIVRGNEDFFADFGEPLVAGDLVITGAGSIAVIRINDRVQVKLREDTHLWIESVTGNPAVTLTSGGVFARVAKSLETIGRRAAGFEVKTPTVVAGVRGTEFFVAYGRTVEEEPDLWLCVNEGLVEVLVPSTGEAVNVEEGEGINILAGIRATEPRFFPWTQKLNWNFDPGVGKIEDKTDLDAAYADLLDQDYD